MKALFATQLISSIFLMVSILLQQRGSGLSGAFGGEGNVYRTKRGVEKILFYSTIVFAFFFFASSLASLLYV